MRTKIRNFTFAIHALFSGEDYLRHITKGELFYDFTEGYQGPWSDKKNMRDDMRNIRSDMQKAIKDYYGKATAQ